jgi:hypothetical protein
VKVQAGSDIDETVNRLSRAVRRAMMNFAKPISGVAEDREVPDFACAPSGLCCPFDDLVECVDDAVDHLLDQG